MNSHTTLPSVAQLFTQSYQLFRKTFWKLLGLAVYPLVPVLFVILVLVVGSSIAPNVSDPSMRMAVIAIGVVAILAGILAAVYIGIRAGIASIHILYSHNQNHTVAEYWQMSSRGWAGFFWARIGKGLIIRGATLLLLIPGIIYSIMYMFALPIYVLEHNKHPGFRAALGRSKTYTNGIKASLFWKLFCMGVVVLVGIVAAILCLVWLWALLPLAVSIVLAVVVGVGVIICLAIVGCANAVLYRTIAPQRHDNSSKPTSKVFVIGMIILGVLFQIVSTSLNLLGNTAKIQNREQQQIPEQQLQQMTEQMNATQAKSLSQ